MKRSVFFQPPTDGLGDLIPFEKDGEFRLFYLHEDRSDPKPGTSWNLVTTKDLTQFEDHGVSLHHGSETDLDFNAYTGSIITDGSGVHHLFYTGQNPPRNLGPDGVPPFNWSCTPRALTVWKPGKNTPPSSPSALRTATSPVIGVIPLCFGMTARTSGGCFSRQGTQQGRNGAAASSRSVCPRTDDLAAH